MDRIEIYDTTLRDGAQTEGISLSLDDKLRIARRLDDFGVALIEGGWPGSNPKDVEFFERARDLPWNHATIAAFGSTRRRNMAPEDDENLRALVASGVAVCTLVGKSWTLHVDEVLRVDREENLAMIEESVAWLVSEGRRVIHDAEHFFDGYRTDRDYALRRCEQRLGEARKRWSCVTRTAGRFPGTWNEWCARWDRSWTPHSESTRTTTASWPSSILSRP